MMSRLFLTAVLAIASALDAAEPASAWRLEPVQTLSGFAQPESVAVDPRDGVLIVSNQNGPFWQKDGRGFLSRIRSDGSVDQPRWFPAEGAAAFDRPAGSAWCRDRLWVADVDCVRVCDPVTRQVRTITPPGAQWLNDVASDGARVFVSDSKANTIFVVHPDDTVSTIPSPPGPNGLAWFDGRLYGVSFSAHEIYGLDADGRNQPEPFGLAQHFTFLDGMAFLADGTLLVSDWAAGRISAVAPDRHAVSTLAELAQPADLIVDEAQQRVYVPQIAPGLVQIFRLVSRHPPAPDAP
jgi:DNA-binding beta-propeller fold protein YncE